MEGGPNPHQQEVDLVSDFFEVEQQLHSLPQPSQQVLLSKCRSEYVKAELVAPYHESARSPCPWRCTAVLERSC